MDVKKNLDSTTFDGNRLSHAYIVSGDLADKIAMAAVCSSLGTKPCTRCAHCGKASKGLHPDIAIVSRLKKKREILVDQIRELRKDVIIVPGEAARKAYIINEAETMNTAAQNAFLRVLEEPPAHAVFILKTWNPAGLLETVRSRCVEVKSQPAPAAGRITDEDIAANFFSAIENGNEQLIRFMYLLEKLERSAFALFLLSARQLAIAESRIAVCDWNGSGSAAIYIRAERVLSMAQDLFDSNVSTGHISGMLCSNFLK